jgi:hypothetical protein
VAPRTSFTATVLQVKAWAVALEQKRLTADAIPEHARQVVQEELLARWLDRRRLPHASEWGGRPGDSPA